MRNPPVISVIIIICVYFVVNMTEAKESQSSSKDKKSKSDTSTSSAAAPGTGSRYDSSLPAFKFPIPEGENTLMIDNRNKFVVAVGLRTGGKKGRNFDIAGNRVESITVPKGQYEVYFVFSNEPDALYQGNNINLKSNITKVTEALITIEKKENGNYPIRKIK